MKKEAEYLRDWLKRFLENRDLIQRQIENIEDKDDGLLVKYKAKLHYYFVVPFLGSGFDCSVLKKEGHSSLVIYNTEENFKYIVSHWKELTDVGRHFSVYCVNPFSKLEKKWIVFPYTHNQISEGQKIAEGLKSLSDMVEKTSEKEILEITK